MSRLTYSDTQYGMRVKISSKEFNTKKEALKFIESISFRNYYKKVSIIYRSKKWIVVVEN